MSKPQTDPPGVPARRAAMRLLDAVLRRGLPLDGALAGATQGIDQPNDRALAHAIAAETLRRLPDLDALIDSATRQRLADDAKARFALRIALVQALALGTPGHAAISTVLPLMDGGPRRLVHGVFGTILRQGTALRDPPSLPQPVAARWQQAWGRTVVDAAERLIARPPPVDLTLADPAATDRWAAALGAASLFPGHLRLPAGHDAIATLPGFAEGAWWVQDIAASLPARLLGAGAGVALDLCAAPGGKTMQLAAAGWTTTAIDLSEQRLARIAENLARTGLAADLVAADALSVRTTADAVLLDAPCSATGIFRRHPDVLHRVRPKAVAALAEAQATLIDHAATLVRPGGRLVYAVCSLEPAEGEAVADGFLARHPGFAIDPIRAGEVPAGFAPDRAGRLRVLPGVLEEAGGADGFFMARFRHG